MDNMFGAKMGNVFISMRERNEAGSAHVKFMEEMMRPIPKPILPAPPKQIFEIKKLRRTLNPEETQRVKVERNLKEYLAYKPPKYNKEELLQGLMIKELLNKQLERNKKLREQVRRGYTTPEDYEKQKVKDSVLLGQVRQIMPIISESLMASGINVDAMEAYLNRPPSSASEGVNESQAEVIARDTEDVLNSVIDAQERESVRTAEILPSESGPATAQSVATRVDLEKKRRGRPRGTTREAMAQRRIQQEIAAREAAGLPIVSSEEEEEESPVAPPTGMRVRPTPAQERARVEEMETLRRQIGRSRRR
jgi:hypothetical protein